MAEKQRVIYLIISAEMQTKLLHWCADHNEDARKRGEKIGMSWAIRKILERYFQSQETMRKVLTREDPALRGMGGERE